MATKRFDSTNTFLGSVERDFYYDMNLERGTESGALFHRMNGTAFYDIILQRD